VEFSTSSGFEKTINAEFMKFKGLSESAGSGASATTAANTLPADSLAFIKRLSDNFVAPGADPTTLRGQVSYLDYNAAQQQLFSLFIKFLETKGYAEILSAPNLVLRRGAEGNIVTGQDVPIQSSTQTGGANTISTTFKSVGIKLRVTPLSVTNGRVRLLVAPEVSNVQEYTTSGAPLVAVRSASTELQMRDGQLVSIGGLLRKEQRQSQRRIPLLSEIPLLGWFFRSHTRETVGSQLVIFLSVRILDEASLDTATLHPAPVTPEAQKALDGMKQSLMQPPSSLKSDLKELATP
jgi:type II secretory pathway component GspD/PulD (secretin)